MVFMNEGTEFFINPNKYLFMKTILITLTTVALLTLQSCQSDQREGHTEAQDETETADKNEVNTEQETPTKMIEKLVGDWDRSGGGQQGAQNNNQQEGMQRITFTEEARYILYNGNQKIDSGAYRMNEQLNNLYLESEINEEPKEFEVQLSEDQLTMKAKQANGQAGNVQYVYRRRQ
jgi:hypothetical protein